MTVHVNIGEAKTRLSELVAAAMRGEDVVLDKAGAPQVKLVPVPEAAQARREQIAARRELNAPQDRHLGDVGRSSARRSIIHPPAIAAKYTGAYINRPNF